MFFFIIRPQILISSCSHNPIFVHLRLCNSFSFPYYSVNICIELIMSTFNVYVTTPCPTLLAQMFDVLRRYVSVFLIFVTITLKVIAMCMPVCVYVFFFGNFRAIYIFVFLFCFRLFLFQTSFNCETHGDTTLETFNYYPNKKKNPIYINYVST